jgi:hypothetical protein
LGKVEKYNIVISVLPDREYSTASTVNSDVLTGAFPEEGSHGAEVVEVEGFANVEVDWCSCSVLRGSWV